MDETPELHSDVEETARRIAEMEVRGAASIADAAAAALGTQAATAESETPEAFRRTMRAAARRLYETRPTAVSLPNALRYVLSGMDGDDVETLQTTVQQRVSAFRDDLDDAQDRLGQIGAGRFSDGDVVMTHCHSSDALSCIEAAVESGADIEAVVKETRPRKQGHITASELRELGVPVTLIVDSAAHSFLDDVDHVLVGADSIAADGSVINKIGTAGLAVSARDRGVPVVVAAQSIKLHPKTLTGTAVAIERRDIREVLDEETHEDIGAAEVANPAFDVTPPRHVDAIVTEHGQFPPESIVTLMRELFGDSVSEPWTDPDGTGATGASAASGGE
ncbi:ribose-1,5-bisphosphate isomerase [Natronomonas pharaonis DSM 2160]|uniref:Ribose 1,5-bisphosphate isomerase n=1 Tax=Natronomonas pharaonis (strain ATCC 35678 / DSM 2160 / CIP 103997 / JCM 8858 / NBRC 14720 / NCIMB 2260 / Gabara) TaxID=348780 RepID=Q3IQA4_NATPD|nr:ribose 1,5-bisphosphate isomerase [Natronomonas pharaonis]CAI49692.1 ribose-1,5-bisphosphate isomerase [Natronomonas pharaonis DSM 2160]